MFIFTMLTGLGGVDSFSCFPPMGILKFIYIYVIYRLLTPPGTPLGNDSHSSLAAPKITPSARASSASKASRVFTKASFLLFLHEFLIIEIALPYLIYVYYFFFFLFAAFDFTV